MEKEWKRDWANFDWEPVKEALDKKEKEGIKDMDVGITVDEFIDFLEWLGVYDKTTFTKLMCAYKLVDIGFTVEQALLVITNEELLDDILEHLIEKLRSEGEDI